VHLGLYALLIALPLTGWLMVNADGKSAAWFGMSLPVLIDASRPLAHDLHEVHEAISSIGYALIGLHAAAALLHHYVVKDNTLRLMLPGVRAEARSPT
jgi:cytochrome b561